MTRQTLAALAVAALLGTACGGSSPDATATTPPAGQTIVVTTLPAEADVAPGGTLQFSSQVSGTAFTGVVWTVEEAGGGTIDATGLYTAPATEGTYHVRADSAIASAKSNGKSVVHVKRNAQQVTVVVNPATATVQTGRSFTFAAAVTGSTVGSVAWTVQEGPSCGSITSAGVYTAPNVGATCHVVATSTADATRSGSATVTVTAAPVVTVSVSPATASMTTGGTRTFSATVSGTTAGQSTAVTWSVPAGAGTIGASTGVYIAPATPGTYVVTATSVADPTRFATATVTVTAPPPAVAISISPTTVTLDACKGQLFTATVTNTTNTAVTWSVVEPGGGSVMGGAYIAPTTAGTYHVVATSVADPTKAVQATIVVGDEKVLSVAVSPGSGTVQANGQVAFAATVTTTCGTFVAQ